MVVSTDNLGAFAFRREMLDGKAFNFRKSGSLQTRVLGQASESSRQALQHLLRGPGSSSGLLRAWGPPRGVPEAPRAAWHAPGRSESQPGGDPV